jgi:hypothetical protein
LVSSPLDYERVSPGVPFLQPVLPVLPDLAGTTAPQIAATSQLHCENIKRKIVQQINIDLDVDCLADLIGDETGLLQGTVPNILQEFFDTYGAITPQSLTTAKTKLKTTTNNHSRTTLDGVSGKCATTSLGYSLDSSTKSK